MKRDLSQQERTLMDLEQTITILDQMRQKEQENPQMKMEKQEVWLIKEQSQAHSKISELVLSAKKNVQITTNKEGFEVFIETFGKTTQSLALKNIKIKFNTPIHRSSLVKQLRNYYTIKNLEISNPVLFIVIDNTDFLLVPIGKRALGNTFDQPMLFARGEPTLSLVKSLFMQK
jgi:sugar-specific transcriptional regulator TrmB